jgi:hypothetical protein
LLIWLAYFLLPTDAGGLVHGIPLGPIEAAALLMLAWLAIMRVRMPGKKVVGTLLLVAVTAGAAIPGSGGFRARYFANADAAGTHERSVEYRDAAFTKIDARLAFDPEDRQFPLAFFNDNSRFNFYKPGEPHRQLLAFSVRWSGMWWADDDRPRLYLDAPDATAQIFADGAEVMALRAGSGSPIVMEAPVARGWHRLDINYSAPYGTRRPFSAGLVDGKMRRPFDRSMVVTQQIREWQMTGVRLLQRFKVAADVAVLICLTWVFVQAFAPTVRRLRRAPTYWSWRDAAALFAVAAAVDALVFASPWFTHNMLLPGGDDTMTYEGYARDILLNGILMNGGLPLGEGEPFYYQAFYPYFLAAMHYLFGESMFGPVLAQRLLAAFTIWVLVNIAIDLHVERVWKSALPVAAFFIAWKLWPIAAQPLNESLYVPLLAAAAWALVRVCVEPRPRWALGGGALTGLATITRSTALLAWVVAWPVCWVAIEDARHRTRIVVTIAAVFFAIFSLVTIRNWMVARVFAPTSTELGVTLLGGNEVPEGVLIDLTRRSTVYRTLGISDLSATVIEYALTAPGAFLLHQGRKALFALGFYEAYAPGWGLSPVYIAVWTSAIAGVSIAWRNSGGKPWSLLPALIALTQFIAVVIVYPKGERLIVPIHTLLVPYAALAAGWCVERMVDSKRT